jgi:hypothetical protein
MKKKLLLIILVMPLVIFKVQAETHLKSTTGIPADTLFIEKYWSVENIDDFEDYQAILEVLWDMDSIYLKFTIQDDVIWDDGDLVWKQDNIEIYFDMDNSKEPSFDGIDDYQLRLANDFYTWEEMPSSQNAAIQGVRLIYEVTLNGNDTLGYIYDMALPFESMKPGFTPEIGTQIGFDILASDNDGDPVFRDEVSWNSISGDLWKIPYYWGVLEFAAEGKIIPVWDTEPPSVPENLTATVDGAKVILSWDASTDNSWVKGNKVFQDGILIKDGYLGTQPSFTVKDLEEGTHEFSVIAYDIYDNESDAATTEVTVEPDALKNYTADQISVYPNPATNQLAIEFDNNVDQVTSIQLYGITGKVVYSEQFIQGMSSPYTINLSPFGKGIYFLKISTSNITTVKKLVRVD